MAVTPVSDLATNERRYVCKTCHSVYESSQQLGGHTSRSHPGSSEDYKKKLAIRASRAPERAAHKLAKKQFSEKTG